MNAAQTTETASRVVIIVWVATAVHVQEGTHLWRMVDPVQVMKIIPTFLIFISLWEARRLMFYFITMFAFFLLIFFSVEVKDLDSDSVHKHAKTRLTLQSSHIDLTLEQQPKFLGKCLSPPRCIIINGY